MKYNKIIRKLIKESNLLKYINSNYKKIKDIDAVVYEYYNNKYMEGEMAYINRNIYITFKDGSIMLLFYGATYRETEVLHIIKVDEIDMANPEDPLALIDREDVDTTTLFQMLEDYVEEYESSNQLAIQNLYEDIYDSLYFHFEPTIKINEEEKVVKYLQEIVREVIDKTNIDNILNILNIEKDES